MSATAIPELPAGRTLRLGVRRIGYELRRYFRQADGVFFSFLFPIVMIAIFSAAFANVDFGPDGEGGRLKAATYYLPAMIAAGILLSGVQSLAIAIAQEKSDGTLKRLAATPLPVLSYFIGKIGQALVTGIVQSGLVIAVSALLFGVRLPHDPAKWLTFAWVLVFGIITCAILGIALSALPRSGSSAGAVVIPIILVLQFISGVYLPFTQIPAWLQNIASVFPLRWLAQGMRSVFLPDGYATVEVGGSWNLPLVALMTAVWLVAGLVLARVTFRWIRKDS